MPQIAVAMLEINELKTAIPGALGSHHEVVDQLADLAVAHDHDVLLGAELAVQQRVVVEHTGLHPRIVIGLAETARMGELQTDHEILVVSHGLAVRLHQRFAQAGDVGLVAGVHDQLARIGTAVMAHRHGLATPDHFGPGQTEMSPATAGVVAGAAVGCAIPTLHRVNGIAVANGEGAHLQRLGHDGFGAGLQLVIAGHVQTQAGQVFLEAGGAGQGFDFDKVAKFHEGLQNATGS